MVESENSVDSESCESESETESIHSISSETSESSDEFYDTD